MSIFRREPEASNPPAMGQPSRPAPRPEPSHEGPSRKATHIAAGSKVVGQISGSAELHVEGEVEGQIRLDSRVVVGAEGRIEGEIQARAVEVGGKVRGNVRGEERVEVLASGSLEGDVTSPRVIIAEGAFFKGKVEMGEKTGGKPTPPAGGAPRPTTGTAAASGKRPETTSRPATGPAGGGAHDGRAGA